MDHRRHLGSAGTVAVWALLVSATAISAYAQEGTPPVGYSCETAMPASPAAEMDHGAMGTPATGVQMAPTEFDQLYIDMMIPHHRSIIAMADAARPRLTDERLRTIAENIITAQEAESAELRRLREEWYGSSESMPMGQRMMDAMTQQMPGIGAMDQMATLMDPAALVSAFCAGSDPDLTFIDLTIPHHQMAVTASEAAVETATHREIKDIAQGVIEAQQREVDELTTIRAELEAGATPAAS